MVGAAAAVVVVVVGRIVVGGAAAVPPWAMHPNFDRAQVELRSGKLGRL